jgi:hypothetical protein
LVGTRGTIPRFSIAAIARTSSRRTPEWPFKNVLRRSRRTARTTSAGKYTSESSGSVAAPTPTEWLRRMLLWRSARSCGGIGMFLNEPKPVVTP